MNEIIAAKQKELAQKHETLLTQKLRLEFQVKATTEELAKVQGAYEALEGMKSTEVCEK